VVRKFFTNAYLVEVDQCWTCGLAWFDKDELELLQYLYEQSKITGGR
jgi:Zn-finger nucleic acid-binding protein